MPGGKLILIRDVDSTVIARNVPTVKTATKLAAEDLKKAKAKGSYSVVTPKAVIDVADLQPASTAAPETKKEVFE